MNNFKDDLDYSNFNEMRDEASPDSQETNKKLNLLKKKKEKIELLDWLYKSSQEPPEIKKYIQDLKNIANLKNHSMFNRILIVKQKPGAKYVLDPKEWAEEHQRRPKPNAIPIIYFINYGPYKYVYDYSDTIGDKPLDTNLFIEKQKKAIIDETTIELLISSLENKFHIQVKHVDLGITNFGNVARINMYNSIKNIRPYLGDEQIYFSIHIATHLDPPEQLAVICHELAHIYCGHMGEISREIENDKGEKQKEIIIEGRADLGKGTKEFEADAVAFLILSSFDLYSNSDEYIKGYLSKEKINQMEKERFSDYYIMDATKKIEVIIKSLKINYQTLKRKKQLKQIEIFRDKIIILIKKFMSYIFFIFRITLIKVLEYLLKLLKK